MMHKIKVRSKDEFGKPITVTYIGKIQRDHGEYVDIIDYLTPEHDPIALYKGDIVSIIKI